MQGSNSSYRAMLCGMHEAVVFAAGRARSLSTTAPRCAEPQTCADQRLAPGIRWVFLGPPGVGKGTYASRMAKFFGADHIATGDLIRAEIKAGSEMGKQLQGLVSQGKLVPDDLVIQSLKTRLNQPTCSAGFILDGFPRTRVQAEKLLSICDIQLALNLSLREEVLVQKCLGRRECTHCGKGYNVADIYLPASNGQPEIVLPPLSPPPECAGHLEIRADDTEPVVMKRLQAYRSQATPVEDYFRQAGLLNDFEITGGIPETTPKLIEFLASFAPSSASTS